MRLGGRSRIGDKYVRHAGYNEVGEANNIIILYPQVTATLTNPMGCWDWWGYTGPLYGELVNMCFLPVSERACITAV